MTPEFGIDPLPLVDEIQKFIRVGEKVVYDSPMKGHDKIALEHGLINKVPGGEKPTVDDGGFLGITPQRDISIFGITTRCKVIGEEEKARRKTIMLVGSLTNMEVRSLD